MPHQDTVRPLSPPPLSGEFGMYKTVTARFWLWRGPFVRQKYLNPLKLFPSRSAAVRNGRCLSSVSCTTGPARIAVRGAEESSFERRRNNLNGFQDFSLKPRPESGLDCLICGIVARQRSKEPWQPGV